MMDDTDAQPDLFPALARVVRGASILFWCLPVAMVVSIMSTLSNWTDAAWPMGMLLPPMAFGMLWVGLWLLGAFHPQERVWQAALGQAQPPTKNERYEILMSARDLLAGRADEFANLIRLEAGLCMRETRYEVGRAQEVFKFAAAEALRDDENIFSCDAAKTGQARKIFTMREPLRLVAAITPFNHPLNQVAHKLAPAIAAGVPVLLKPSSKTPLTAIRLTELLYEAGLPSAMLSTFVGDRKTITEALVRDPRVDLVTFTGGTGPGKHLTTIAGYKKLCLELGGNAPLIVLRDADLDLAATLATEGSFRNSGQRCTAVKRIVVEEPVLDEFTAKFVAKAGEFVVGDPADEATFIGTVIDEPAAIVLEERVAKAVAAGAEVLLGGQRNGAQLEPTIIANVPRDAETVSYTHLTLPTILLV